MSTIVSKFVGGESPVINGACAGQVVVNRYSQDLTAAQLVKDNIIDLGILPANHTIVDAIVIPDDLDTGETPAITLDIGLLSGTPGDSASSDRTVGTELFSATTAAQGGTLTRASAASALQIKPVDYDRSIGVLIKAAPATAAAGRIRLQLSMAADDPVQF